MKRLHVAVMTVLALAVFYAGCGKSSVSDDTIANDIKAKLYSDATTKPASIDVAVKDGVVTLSGDVPSSDVELEAMKVANATTGVKNVQDQMKVNNASQPSQTASSAPPPAQGAAVPDAADRPARHKDRDRDRADQSAAAPKGPTEVTIPAGTRVSVRTVDAIDSKVNQPGQSFRASLDAPLIAGDRVAVPAGTPVSVTLVSSKSAGRIRGQSGLEVRLTGLTFNGQNYDVNSSSVTEVGKSRGKQTAVRTGIGAAAGAVIGALAGGGKGAAIGSAAGGGAGFGYNVFTHGDQVKIPSESLLTFQLQAPITVTPSAQ